MKAIRVLVNGLILFILCQSGLLAADQKHIFVIESYHKEYPWDASYRIGLEKGLAGKNVKFSYFEMDTKRIPKDQYQASADKAWQRFLSLKPDLVVLGDDNATSYLGPKFKEEGKTPVVYLGVNNNPRAYGLFPVENITGVLERPHMKRSVRQIRELLPNKVKKILILFDSGNTSKIAVKEVFGGKTSLEIANVQVEMQLEGSWEKWQSTVKSLKLNGYDALIIGLYHTLRDATGSHVDADKVLKWTASNTPIPAFAFWDFTVGKDMAIGGLVLFGEIQGNAAAQLIIEILNGKSPGDLVPVIPERGKLLYSKTGLKKWGISTSSSALQGATYID